MQGMSRGLNNFVASSAPIPASPCLPRPQFRYAMLPRRRARCRCPRRPPSSTTRRSPRRCSGRWASTGGHPEVVAMYDGRGRDVCGQPRVQPPGAFRGGTQQLLNAVGIGAPYLPQNQDPTLGTSTIPGAPAYTPNLQQPGEHGPPEQPEQCRRESEGPAPAKERRFRRRNRRANYA